MTVVSSGKIQNRFQSQIKCTIRLNQFIVIYINRLSCKIVLSLTTIVKSKLYTYDNNNTKNTINFPSEPIEFVRCRQTTSETNSAIRLIVVVRVACRVPQCARQALYNSNSPEHNVCIHTTVARPRSGRATLRQAIYY